EVNQKNSRKPMKVNLVTHGSESVAKGGPTQRTRYTETLLNSTELVEASHCANVTQLVEGEVAHVFNSWPPDSALATIREVKNRRGAIVFSPIMLLLNYYHEYVGAS